MTPFNALNAVWGAYWAMFARLDRFLYFAVIWLAVGAVVVLMVPELLERSLEGQAEFERVPPAKVFAAFGELIVLLAALICMSIAWHRWIILGEPMNRILPERGDIAAAYTWRTLVLLSVPLTVTAAVILATGPYNDEADVSWTVDGPVYVLTTLIMAAIARCLLALTACAVGDKDLTFRASWRLTAGHWWPLFTGYLACALPFNVAAFLLGDFSTGLVEGSVEQSAVDYLTSVIGVMGEIVCAAFLSFAYLHFTSGQPSEREPARYFS